MPRAVDHDERRREIIAATNAVISEKGLHGLTFRAVADRLGGSTTLVTHYYSSQRELLDGLATSLIEGWEKDLERLEADASDAYERLRVLLRWLLPLDAKGLIEERSRINLLSEQFVGGDTKYLFDAWETRMRDFLRTHLEELVPANEVESKASLLRVLTNGLTLSAIEHPERWPKKRLLQVLDEALVALNLAPTHRAPTRKPAAANDRGRPVARQRSS